MIACVECCTPSLCDPTKWVYMVAWNDTSWKSAWCWDIVWTTLELSVKSLKEGSNCGFYPYWRFFLLLNNSLAHRTLTPILKVGCDSGTFSLHLSNFKRILGSKIGYAHRTHHLVSDWPMQGQLVPPNLVGQAEKLVFNSPTLLFVHNSLSI